MIITSNALELAKILGRKRKNKESIGFVPTMGALHEGHISLIKVAKKKADFIACSIFINPTQFNNPEDLRLYPVQVEKDIRMLLQAGCDLLFLPSVDQIYPPDFQKKSYELGSLEMVLEGSSRPGHFQGVCMVVDRLLSLVAPDYLFLGQKDYQQCLVISKLLELTGRKNVSLIICPTVRESSGLAMSSRNQRLKGEALDKAQFLHKGLQKIRKHWKGADLKELEGRIREDLEAIGYDVHYVAIRKRDDLASYPKEEKAVGLVAAQQGPAPAKRHVSYPKETAANSGSHWGP